MATAVLEDFDEYTSRLTADAVDVIHLEDESAHIQVPPRFLLGAMPTELSHSLFGELWTGPVRLYRLKNGRVSLDGIISHGSTVLHSWMFNHPDYYVRGLMEGALAQCLALPVRRIEEDVVLLTGPGHGVYGHWLVDLLPRLWVLQASGLDLTELKFLIPASSPGFVAAMLQIFRIRETQLIRYDEQAEIVEVASLILPTNLRRGSRLQSSMRAARQFLLDQAQPVITSLPLTDRPRRFFVSRRRASPSRTLGNRARVEDIAQEAGYSLVCPEEFPIAEQLCLFQNAECVIGEYGSGLHTAIFAGASTKICALRGTSLHPGFIQSSIADVCGQSIGYVFGSTPLDAVDQTFDIDEQLFRVAIELMRLPSLGQRS